MKAIKKGRMAYMWVGVCHVTLEVIILQPEMKEKKIEPPTICICETKDADRFAVTTKLISAFVFATRIIQFLFYLNPKFQASSSFL